MWRTPPGHDPRPLAIVMVITNIDNHSAEVSCDRLSPEKSCKVRDQTRVVTPLRQLANQQ